MIRGRGRAMPKRSPVRRFRGARANHLDADDGRRVGADPLAVDSTAVYLAHMTNELAKLARRAGLDLLGYLLDMARLEAATCARAGRTEIPPRIRGLSAAAARRTRRRVSTPDPRETRGSPAPPQKGFQVDVGVNFR